MTVISQIQETWQLWLNKFFNTLCKMSQVSEKNKVKVGKDKEWWKQLPRIVLLQQNSKKHNRKKPLYFKY